MRTIPRCLVQSRVRVAGLAAAVALSAAAHLVGLTPASAQTDWSGQPEVRVLTDASGSRLRVGGEDFMVFGMNWDYFPIGTNYAYSLWTQPDHIIEAALEREMPLLQAMGVNAIRQYIGVPPRWVQYIYETYGIWSVLNHPCARYGFTIDGVWIPNVDYADPRLREAVRAEVLSIVEEFRNVPGMLMWLLGNENNYGLTWTSFEIEALPEGERDTARARALYSLFGEIIDGIKAVDERPVAIANGDVQYIDVIAQECGNLDVFGTNVYRGISARDLFQVVKTKLNVPVMFTEFGCDAWNAKEMREDQHTQAVYLLGQWQEIYEQSSGKGRVGNAIGGLIFQWTDGWWKFRQEERLDVHDTNASWPNAGYPVDYVEGENNMNEEWWGITAKGHPDPQGLYDVYPRAAYYTLERAFRLNPYAPNTDLETIRRHFAGIEPAADLLTARGDRAALIGNTLERARVSGLRLEFETYNTGGKRVTTPEDPGTQTGVPAFQGFDQAQSFYVDIEAKPLEYVTGHLSLNMLGAVPTNPIDEIFYENRGQSRVVESDDGDFELQGIERVKVYQAGVSWTDRWFHLEGFYRTGHFHWGYEGDFFGLYREANYGENIDIYNGVAPVGVEVEGHRALSGLKLAYGPELWWGANPALLLKYQRTFGSVVATGMFHEDVDEQSALISTVAVPVPPTRTATLHLETTRGSLGLEVGGIWGGKPKVGETFQIADDRGDEILVLEDEIVDDDTYGGKVKVTWQRGRWNWYAQAAYYGLVAAGGPTSALTFTGWTLKDSGSSNQKNILTGLAVNAGNFQFAPNFLWQKPIVGPMPADAPAPGRPRNVIDDPFAVRANRETVGAEFLLTWDPTPGTWLWAWDNDLREDARFAGSIGYVFRHLPTVQDASIGILDNGDSFAFPGSTPARDLWEINARAVSRLRPDVRLVAHAYVGTGEPNGNDPRKIERFGADARLAWGSYAYHAIMKVDDWGPYDYHRDFNLTFPLQLTGDVSRTLGPPAWFGFAQTRMGVRTTWRSLDSNSPRYCPDMVPGPDGTLQCDPNAPGDLGREWEIRTYLHFAL